MKVFVLIKECVNDYEQCLTPATDECRVYARLAQAREVMLKEYNAELPDWEERFTDPSGKVFLDTEKNHTNAYIASKGRYDEDHISWNIYEREIQ